jgi:hypothetical protein
MQEGDKRLKGFSWKVDEKPSRADVVKSHPKKTDVIKPISKQL